MKKLILSIALFMAAGTPAFANTVCDNLSTVVNRPTVGYSACNVTAGNVVEELGYQNGNNVAQYPQAFNRFGITKNFEFDILGPNYNRSTLGNGYSDNGLGFKYGIVNNEKFAFGVDALFTMPRDSKYSAGRATSTINLNAAYVLTPNTGVTTTLAYGNTGFISSLTVSEQIDAARGFYVEYVGAKTPYYDYGIQNAIGKRVIVDAELGSGHGIKYAGFGLSLKI